MVTSLSSSTNCSMYTNIQLILISLRKKEITDFMCDDMASLISVCLYLKGNSTESTYVFHTFWEEVSSKVFWRNTRAHSQVNVAAFIILCQDVGFWTWTQLKRTKALWSPTATWLEVLLSAFAFPQLHLNLTPNEVIFHKKGYFQDTECWK